MLKINLTTLIVLVLLSSVLLAHGGKRVTVYQNEGCGHCGPYVAELKQRLASMGFADDDVEVKYILGDEETRKEFAALQESFNVPAEMYGHLVVYVDDKYLFEGHVPPSMIENFMKNDAAKFQSVVVTQDKMTDTPESYLLLKEGKIVECDAKRSIGECYSGSGSGVGASSGLLDFNLLTYAGLGIGILLVLYLFVKRGK